MANAKEEILYDENLKKVYSIWVCTRCKEEYQKDTITSYSVENEYQIPYNEDIERSVEEMCNASQGVLNKGIEIGTEKGIEIGVIKGKVEAYHEIGMNVSEIAAKMNISEKEVNDIISEFAK